MSREESPAPMLNMGTLGTLFLVGRKTGVDLSSFPIDKERLTIGRDYDCDIRLYFSDVSKLHCEIVFDLLTGRARMHVHGSNGITHTTDAQSSLQKPPAVLNLTDKDTFMLRKKVFRFEYGPVETEGQVALAYSSPARTPLKSTSGRRASRRMSLVPEGREFTPGKPRSKLAEQVEEDEAMDIVDVIEGEGGDKVYLESSEGPEEGEEETAASPISGPALAEQTSRQSMQAATPTRMGPWPSDSLRKNLLMRSARKVFESTPTIDGAILSGTVETRRKSLSPKTARKSILETPQIIEQGPSDEEEDEEEGEDDDEADPLEWVYEDGMADMSIEESESDQESFEADASLDIPGQSVMTFTPIRPSPKRSPAMPTAIPAEAPPMAALDEEEDYEANNASDEQMAEPEVEIETPVASASSLTPRKKPLNAFMTPQPRRRHAAGTIAATVGPAVRVMRPFFEPGSMGSPVTMGTALRTTQPQKETSSATFAIPETPLRSTDESVRRRKSLATPRALPLPPASGFKDLVRETPARNARFHSLDEDTAEDVPSTHIGDIKRRLTAMRRQSQAASERRVTLSAIKPETASSDEEHPSAEDIEQEDIDQEEQEPATPEPSSPTPVVVSSPWTVSLHDILPQRHNDRPQLAASSSGHSDLEATPRQVQREPPTTPSFEGVREMYRPVPPTPTMYGIANMFQRERKVVPKTPRFDGLKAMYREVPPTPAMDGIADMYAPPPPNEVAEEIVLAAKSESPTKTTTAKVEASPPAKGTRAPARSTKVPEQEAKKARSVRTPTSASTRTTRSTSADVESRSMPTRATRGAAPAEPILEARGEQLPEAPVEAVSAKEEKPKRAPRKATPKAMPKGESLSAPVRRTRKAAEVEKENEPEVEAKAPVRRTTRRKAEGAAPATPASAPMATRTRSRK